MAFILDSRVEIYCIHKDLSLASLRLETDYPCPCCCYQYPGSYRNCEATQYQCQYTDQPANNTPWITRKKLLPRPVQNVVQ